MITLWKKNVIRGQHCQHLCDRVNICVTVATSVSPPEKHLCDRDKIVEEECEAPAEEAEDRGDVDNEAARAALQYILHY